MEDKPTEYRFNTGTARISSARYGVSTRLHQRRSNPNEYGVNVACFENVSPFDFPEVKVMDGVNHPMDGDSGHFDILFSRERGRAGMIAARYLLSGYSWQWVTETGETMLCVEKDDPREAPESGDKKPQPKKNDIRVYPPPAPLVAFLFPGTQLTAIQMV